MREVLLTLRERNLIEVAVWGIAALVGGLVIPVSLVVTSFSSSRLGECVLTMLFLATYVWTCYDLLSSARKEKSKKRSARHLSPRKPAPTRSLRNFIVTHSVKLGVLAFLGLFLMYMA